MHIVINTHTDQHKEDNNMTTNTTTPCKLTMRGTLTKEAYKCLTAPQRRALLKHEQAEEYSGLRAYPTTCARVMDRIPDDWWSKYSAAHIGDMMRLLYQAYEDGKRQG